MAIYKFGPFRLDPAERLLLRGQQPIPLKPKAFDLLVVLVERHGRLITKQQLMDALWPATSVEEGNLTHTISTLRKALGDGQDGEQFIETVPTHGYRFVSPIREQTVAATAQPPDSPVAPTVTGRQIPTRLIAFALLAAILAGTAAWWRVDRSKDPVVFSDHKLTRLTADAGLTAYPAISPDGKLVAYASDRGGGNLDIWVQQIAGGDAAPLTRDAADDYEPAFSPDGTRIAFRSNRDGGGIYIVSTLGGEAKLIAPDGRRPKFSPDGQWLAYWVGFEHIFGNTYVIAVDGGQPRRIIVGDHLTPTRSPVWSPDGQRLLITSRSDWWIAPLDGGPAIKTGAASILRSAALHLPDDVAVGHEAPPPEEWREDGDVLFSAVSGDSRNLWAIALNSETRFAVGRPARLTFGTQWELHASSSAGRLTAFASVSLSSNLWRLPVETNTGRPTGNLQRITEEERRLTSPDISRDGRILVFQEGGEKRKGVLRLHNLDEGLETNALDSEQDRGVPALTADGARVLYATLDQSLYTIAARGGVSTRICEACDPMGTHSAYSPTGDRVAYTTPVAVMQFDVSTRTAKRIADRGLRLPQTGRFLRVKEMRYSPDGQWLAFHALDPAGRGIFLIDLTRTDGKDAEWIPATTEPSVSDARVAWSPDGNLLYFVSDRDGFRCLWAQRLQTETKRPVDRPVAVYHFHRASPRISHSPGRVGVAVARNKIVLALEELRGNVWMLEPPVNANGQPARD
jgi:Tol biopolymer transport system component/DNA-binding winged helix-turn-helix (wHTH) protein